MRSPQIGPWPLIATCVSQDQDTHTVNVLLRNGQILPAAVLTVGANDALRVRQRPLPGIGTDGVIAFPHGDQRNAIWLGSVPRNQTDAFSPGQNEPYAEYEADWSGGWRLRGQAGGYAEVWPDTTSLVIGYSGTVPTTYRHTLDASQQRQRTPFTQSQRNPSPAAAMPWVLNHAAGAAVSISSGGVVTVTGAGGATVTLAADGSVTVAAHSGSRVNVTGGSVYLGASGATRGVARIGDAVSGGVITGGSSNVFSE